MKLGCRHKDHKACLAKILKSTHPLRLLHWSSYLTSTVVRIFNEEKAISVIVKTSGRSVSSSIRQAGSWPQLILCTMRGLAAETDRTPDVRMMTVHYNLSGHNGRGATPCSTHHPATGHRQGRKGKLKNNCDACKLQIVYDHYIVTIIRRIGILKVSSIINVWYLKRQLDLNPFNLR